MKVFLLDDEPLAVTRLRQLLEQDGRVQIAGWSTRPRQALLDIQQTLPDILFLDIKMPGMSGFELLEQLEPMRPLVIFTTAYDQFALEAFKVNSVDYLLKPIEPEALHRAITKLQRIHSGVQSAGNILELVKRMRAKMEQLEPTFLVRVASRTGDRVTLIDVSQVSHFYAKDKLTFAATAVKDHAIDMSIAALEEKLSPRQWVRIHRSTILNVDAVKELRSVFGGKLLVRLKDGKTQLRVTRERAASVRSKLGV